MDAQTQAILDELRSPDGDRRYNALKAILALTDSPVGWAYEAWEGLVAHLRHTDAHQRAIAAQLLCNLAKSDPEQRMLHDFAALIELTRDAKFVTARHTLQALWKVALAGEPQRALVLDQLAARYSDCRAEKNSTLIRYDILQGLRKIYDAAPDEALWARALALIEIEERDSYRKKYAALWRRPA